MRAFEFLKEASVFKTTNNQYVPGYRLSIATASQAGQATLAAIKTAIPDFNPSEELTVADPAEASTVKVVISPKAEKSFKLKRPNGAVFELVGGKGNIEGSLNALGRPADATTATGKPVPVKLPNKGDTAEALLGAAMFAKLQARQGGAIGSVTNADLWKVFDVMTPVADDDYKVTSKDMGGATDTIWFRLKVKGFVKNALSNPELRKKLDAWASSPVNYVNSKEGTEYAEEFYKNGEPDEVGVISDGLSAQSEKKTDVYTAVRDPDTNTVKKELLPISLKAGSEQFAQKSGSKFSAMQELFGQLGINVDSLAVEYEAMQKANKKIEASAKIYAAAADLINAHLGDDKKEAIFIDNLVKALRLWATSGNDNIRLVSFGSRGKFDVLRFDNLLPKMAGIKLVAEFIPGKNPKVVVKDPNQGELFQIRTYLQTKDNGATYQRNAIEKGELLGKLANAIE